MKKAHHECDEELIGRYFDGELNRKEHESIGRHLKDCPSCQKILQDNQAISTVFRDSLEREVSQTDFGVVETRVLDQTRHKRRLDDYSNNRPDQDSKRQIKG